MVRHMRYILILPGLITYIFFLIVPLGIMTVMSFFKPVWPGYKVEFTVSNYISYLTSPQFKTMLINTLYTSIGTAFICLVIGFPFAYCYTFKVKSQRAKNYITMFLLAPFLIDWTIRSVAWLSILGEGGVLNSLLLSSGLISKPLKILFTPAALFIIWVQTNLLFMIFPINLALGRLDPEMIDAARVLKAPPHRVIYDIIFKASLPGVICGFIFVFVNTISDYVTPALWAGGMQTLGLSVSTYASQFLWPQASAAGIILLVVCIIVLYILLKIVDIKKLVYE
jgi:ABC-type spermidine/putrescine transport system permease subunit I